MKSFFRLNQCLFKFFYGLKKKKNTILNNYFKKYHSNKFFILDIKKNDPS